MTTRDWKRRYLVPAIFIALSVAAAAWLGPKLRIPAGEAGHSQGDAAVERAFEKRGSGRVVEVAATVVRELPDDREGSRHQRFIIRLASGRTLLVAHNIDLAPRVPLSKGDRVEIRGQYEWNDRGGLLHWTHHDPQGRRPGGWIRYRGESYR